MVSSSKYPEMYLKVPITISNLLDTKFFDTQDLKLIEIYEKTEKEAAVVRVKATFDVKKSLPVGFRVLISEFEDQWVPFLYGSMSLICFHCGIIGHHVKDCQNSTYVVENEDLVEEGQLGQEGYKQQDKSITKSTRE